MDSAATPPAAGKERSSKLNGTHFFSLSCLSKPQSLSFPIHSFLQANYNGLKSNWQLREEDGGVFLQHHHYACQIYSPAWCFPRNKKNEELT